MTHSNDQPPVLVVSRDPAAGQSLTDDLRTLGRIAVYIDGYDAALQMIRDVEFGTVIVNVDDESDWSVCRRIAARAACPVAVATRLLARDRRYRRRAFRAGVAAYLFRDRTRLRLRQILTRLTNGERSIESVDGARYSHS
jgi:DNA-binding response OmpR family regulator